jgi:hypothetical protein
MTAYNTHKRKSSMPPLGFFTFQIGIYFVEVSYIFQPYVVTIRLAYKKENKYTDAFKIDMALIYTCKG